jgi:Na+/H+ antiporter NhaD/arsenite permease-like protein
LRAIAPAAGLGLVLAALPRLAWGASGVPGAGTPALDGAQLGPAWTAPFVILLAAIAVLPLAAPGLWHRHYGKIANLCALGFLVPCAVVFGFDVALYELLHTMLLEYVPFVVLLLALFTVAGGVRIKGTFVGTPRLNTTILALGTILASWMGTTGACMLLIRPLIQANLWRARSTHVFVFFIFLVGNIGGGLTPLGDPPLFIGFLQGVDFFWVTMRMLGPTLVVAVPLLIAFAVIDAVLYRREGPPPAELLMAGETFGIEGKRNLALLAAIVAIVLASGVWQPGLGLEIFHVRVALDEGLRSLLLAAIALLSWRITLREIRARNQFSWFPIVEVAKLFFGIFVTIVPVIAIIRAGEGGVARAVVDLVTSEGRPDEAMYFWVAGLMSSVLDNAPTYLMFFNLAGGDAETLMGRLGGTLLAVSAGSVFMGALTYIGNAPNFLVRTIAVERGIRMPSFFGYVAWSLVFLLPLLALVSLLFLR